MSAFRSERVQVYIANNSKRISAYVEARGLVLSCLPDILPAVKALRTSGVRIRDIDVDRLAPLLSGTRKAIIERLCERFQG